MKFLRTPFFYKKTLMAASEHSEMRKFADVCAAVLFWFTSCANDIHFMFYIPVLSHHIKLKFLRFSTEREKAFV